MSVSSVASSSNAYLPALQQQSGTSALPTVGREQENDRDKDDGVAAAKALATSVNLNRQTTGTTINVTA